MKVALSSSYIANCVFNGFSSYTTTMLNIVTILAMSKTSSLPKPLKTLLLSLVISDLCVGLLVQPLYITVLVMELEQNSQYNPTFKTTDIALHITGNLFSHVSFLSVIALSADRFLAFHLHLRYQELVTHKRVAAVVISIWVFNTLISLMTLCFPPDIIYMTFEVIEVACIITATILNYKIYLIVRRHTNQLQAIHAQQVAEHGEMENVRRQRKPAVATVYVYLVFLACYLPQTSISIVIRILGSSTMTKTMSIYTLTLVMINSSLNPMIYCWKMRQIRHALVDMLRNAFKSHN